MTRSHLGRVSPPHHHEHRGGATPGVEFGEHADRELLVLEGLHASDNRDDRAFGGDTEFATHARIRGIRSRGGEQVDIHARRNHPDPVGGRANLVDEAGYLCG